MIEVSWQPESDVRLPEMVVGFDTVAVALYQRLQKSFSTDQKGSAQNPRWDNSAALLLGNNFLALKAKASMLPWVEGLNYLSTSTPNSKLYFPTALQPNVPIPWLENALRDTLKDDAKSAHSIASPSGKNETQHQKHDLLYWPTTNRLIQADRYWSTAVVKQNNLLTQWYSNQRMHSLIASRVSHCG
ncbi:MAG: hypothetical protein AAGB19_06500 [Cyanobacteria bacterium P01_F01_bin.3]